MARKTSDARAVGHYLCPNPAHKGKVIAIIREKNNEAKTLYGYCAGSETEPGCGITNWNMPAGQEFFRTKGTLWGASGCPKDLPQWIQENRACWTVFKGEVNADGEAELPPGTPAPLSDPPDEDASPALESPAKPRKKAKAKKPTPALESPPVSATKDKGFKFPWEK